MNGLLDSGYVSQNGFAHEDWHFSGDLSSDGYVHGYCSFTPKKLEGRASIAFATYEGNYRWSLVGFYEFASFDKLGANYSSKIINRRVEELLNMQKMGNLDGPYNTSSKLKVFDLLKDDLSTYCWKVNAKNVLQSKYSISIPKNTLPNIGFHFNRHTEITEDVYARLRSLFVEVNCKKSNDDSDDLAEYFPEGRVKYRVHRNYERNRKAVQIAKDQFLKKHGRLFCEICNFDFNKNYGELGADFIEAHHRIPVCELGEHGKTSPDDLLMLCSNCHKMVHRYRPWLDDIHKIRFALNVSRERIAFNRKN
ncbi:HNH endonuclease [Brucella anthropi]|uniref:HNH endonuclease n=1 Tax=Brucella anthropi TaxID=529 RepID=UPI001AECF8D2|nr:HNH endonuclease [Ochrobactrum sp. MYb49]